MKSEKVHQHKRTRMIKKTNNGSNQIQFIDNRPSKSIQILQENVSDVISHIAKRRNRDIVQKKKDMSLATKCIQMNDFEGILKDKKGRKKEHHVLVYGTEDARMQQRGEPADEKKGISAFAAASPNLPDGFKNKEKKQPFGYATTGFYTVDRYNNYSWRDFAHGTLEPYFSIFNPLYLKDKLDEGEIRKDLEEFTEKQSYNLEEDRKEVLDYQKKLLNHPSYSPIKTLQESEKFVLEKEPVGDQKTTADEDKNGVTPKKKEVAKSRFELQTRRACKFGLVYMANKKKDRANMGEIAFLSSVHGNKANEQDKKEPTDSSSILNKAKTTNRAGGGSSSERVPITTSEQRKLFRIRSGNIGIRFYDRYGKLIKAPWNKEGEGWNEYAHERRQKYEILAEKLKVSKKGTLEKLKQRVTGALRIKYPGKSLSEMIWLYNKPSATETAATAAVPTATAATAATT